MPDITSCEKPAEWSAVKLKATKEQKEEKMTSGSSPTSNNSPFGGVKLKNAPKPTDYTGGEPNHSSNNRGKNDNNESEYDAIKSRLRKVQ